MDKIELLKKIGEIRATISGQKFLIDFNTKEVNGGVREDFEEFVNFHEKELVETAEVVKWLTHAEYCQKYNISKQRLYQKVREGKVRTKRLSPRTILYMDI